MRIAYLSFGISKTGGYRHEKFLFDALCTYYRKQTEVHEKMYRRNRWFESLFAYFDLSIWGFLKSGADINIVTSRTAIPAMLRNYFNNKEVWIVMHNYDENDGKSALLAYYFRLLFKILRRKNTSRFKVICVAPYWLKYFREVQKLPHVHLFPNLFDSDYYRQFRTTHKNAWVHMGQFGSKNDPKIFELAAMLSSKGYYCYFSTLIPAEASPGNGRWEVIYFNGFRDYLEHLSRSCCNLALSRVKEGWPRISHESILVGTPVIGYNRGGLGDLLKESSSIVVADIDEAFTCITESLWVLPDDSFAKKYDICNADDYLTAICQS